MDRYTFYLWCGFFFLIGVLGREQGIAYDCEKNGSVRLHVGTTLVCSPQKSPQ